MSTMQNPQVNSQNIATSTQGSGNALDSLWSLSETTGSGVYYKTVLALAGNMDAVEDVIDSYSNQVVVLMKQAKELEKKMSDQSENDTGFSMGSMQNQTKNANMNWSETQLISNQVSTLGSRIGQSSSLFSALKQVGDAVITMFDKTAKTRKSP